MPIVPVCSDKRYTAIDELIGEIHGQDVNPGASDTESDLGATLMCRFWDLLKENPKVDLELAVQDHLAFCDPDEACGSARFCQKADSEFMDETRRHGVQQMIQKLCDETRCIIKGQQQKVTTHMRCEVSKSTSHASCGGPSKGNTGGQRAKGGRGACGSTGGRKVKPHDCGVEKPTDDQEPLTEALHGIKEAQTHDSDCAQRLSDLTRAEERISAYVRRLEARELEGIAQLQQADAMWTRMEEEYHRRLREAKESKDTMLGQEREIKLNLSKWRRKEKQRQIKLDELQAATKKVEEQALAKQSQAEQVAKECDSIRTKTEAVKLKLEELKSDMEDRSKASRDTKHTLEQVIKSLEKKVEEERSGRDVQRQTARGTVRGARDNLGTACKVLLQAQLELEDHNGEEESIKLEIEVMAETMANCHEKCRARAELIKEEIAEANEQIARYNGRCARCHQGCSTSNMTKMCTDCPRCLEDRNCQFEDGTTCSSNAGVGCACHVVKGRFMENILENMYNILEANVKKNGDALASNIVESLKGSRNGKLDAATRQKVHNYIRKNVEEKLEMSVMGGAVKTRCEMEPDLLKELLLCLKDIQVSPPPPQPPPSPKSKGKHIDKEPPKLPCKQWGPSNAGGAPPCGCPNGPDACVCKTKAPTPAAGKPTSCPDGVTKSHSTTTCSRRPSAERAKHERERLIGELVGSYHDTTRVTHTDPTTAVSSDKLADVANSRQNIPFSSSRSASQKNLSKEEASTSGPQTPIKNSLMMLKSKASLDKPNQELTKPPTYRGSGKSASGHEMKYPSQELKDTNVQFTDELNSGSTQPGRSNTLSDWLSRIARSLHSFFSSASRRFFPSTSESTGHITEGGGGASKKPSTRETSDNVLNKAFNKKDSKQTSSHSSGVTRSKSLPSPLSSAHRDASRPPAMRGAERSSTSGRRSPAGPAKDKDNGVGIEGASSRTGPIRGKSSQIVNEINTRVQSMLAGNDQFGVVGTTMVPDHIRFKSDGNETIATEFFRKESSKLLVNLFTSNNEAQDLKSIQSPMASNLGSQFSQPLAQGSSKISEACNAGSKITAKKSEKNDVQSKSFVKFPFASSFGENVLNDFDYSRKENTRNASPSKRSKKNDGFIIYCDPNLCTGPCSKRKKSPMKKGHAKLSAVISVSPHLESSLGTDRKTCKCSRRNQKDKHFNDVNDPCLKSAKRHIVHK